MLWEYLNVLHVCELLLQIRRYCMTLIERQRDHRAIGKVHGDINNLPKYLQLVETIPSCIRWLECATRAKWFHKRGRWYVAENLPHGCSCSTMLCYKLVLTYSTGRYRNIGACAPSSPGLLHPEIWTGLPINPITITSEISTLPIAVSCTACVRAPTLFIGRCKFDEQSHDPLTPALPGLLHLWGLAMAQSALHITGGFMHVGSQLGIFTVCRSGNDVAH
jgi:hypothetical protein